MNLTILIENAAEKSEEAARKADRGATLGVAAKKWMRARAPALA